MGTTSCLDLKPNYKLKNSASTTGMQMPDGSVKLWMTNIHAQKFGETVLKPLLPLLRWFTISRTHGARFDSTLPLPHSVIVKKKSGFEFHVIPVYRYNNTFAGPIVTSQVFFWFLSLWLFERRELRRIWEWWHKTLCSHCRSQLWLPHTTIGQSFQHCNILFYH